MDYEKLEQLKRLHDSGALNDEEFEKEKKKILDEEATAKPTAVLPMGLTENAYLTLMNFAMFIPYVGWIALLYSGSWVKRILYSSIAKANTF